MKKLVLSLVILCNIAYADRWSDFGIKANDIEEWKKINNNPFYIKKWIDAGVVLPNEAKKWKKVGVDSNWAKEWKKSGVKKPSEAKKWIEAFDDYSSSKYWFDNKITDVKEAKEWKKLNIYPDDAYEWKKNGLTPDNARKYKDLYVAIKASQEKPKNYSKSKTNQEANQEWQNIGVKTKNEVRDWKNMGYDIEDTKYLISNGIKTPNEAHKLNKEYHLNIEDIKSILYEKDEMEIDNIQEYIQWKDAKISTSYIKIFKKLGFKNPKKAKEWLEITQIKENKIKEWTKFGLKDPTVIKEWYKATNGNYRETKKWVNIGIKSAKKMLSYKKQGFDISDINRALKLKISLKELSIWKKIGISDIEQWYNIGIKTPQKAQEWISIDMTIPKIIKGLLKSEYSTPKKYKSICNKTYTLVNLITNNPHNNIDTCVAGCFSIKQVLSKNQAFGYTNLRSKHNKAVIINTNENLNKDLSQGANICGVFKVTDIKDIELKSNKTTTANILKRLSWFSLH